MTPYYYVREIEKIEIALLDVFNNLRVNKYKDTKRQIFDRTVRIPIVTHTNDDFANWVTTVRAKQVAQPIPVAGLRCTGTAPDDARRVQPTYTRRIFYEPLNRWIQDIQPTPYIFKFELEILCDNISDFRQVKENIEPYFNTYRTLRIKEFDFAPKLERQIPFTIGIPGDQVDDEKELTSNEYQFYHAKYNIEAHGVYHRPYELPEMIRYAQMDFNIDERLIDSLQVFVYPDAIAQQKKQLWETVEPSRREGYSLLKTFTRTLVKQYADGNEEYWKDVTLRRIFLTAPQVLGLDENGNPQNGYNPQLVGYEVDDNGKYVLDENGDRIPIYDFTEVVVDDVARPTEVPEFDLLHLTFDDDSDVAKDFSGMGRDFVAINAASREFVPSIPPGNGSYAPGGYASDGLQNSGVAGERKEWSQILDWFGDNEGGLIESSYTFKATLQFKELGDTVFQYLYNPEDTTAHDGTVIPKGTVWFDWGVMDNRLYFTFHTATMHKTFRTDEYDFDTETIYSFYFVLYNHGENGAFGVKTNFSDTMVAVNTFEVADGS